jgi:hypothetical protein
MSYKTFGDFPVNLFLEDKTGEAIQLMGCKPKITSEFPPTLIVKGLSEII